VRPPRPAATIWGGLDPADLGGRDKVDVFFSSEAIECEEIAAPER
jgi:hypothetical protein